GLFAAINVLMRQFMICARDHNHPVIPFREKDICYAAWAFRTFYTADINALVFQICSEFTPERIGPDRANHPDLSSKARGRHRLISPLAAWNRRMQIADDGLSLFRKSLRPHYKIHIDAADYCNHDDTFSYLLFLS